MPTYYTEELYKHDMPTAQWLKERLVRNFGVAICLREEVEMDQAEITEALRERAERESYYEQRIRELQEEEVALRATSEADLQALIDEKNAETRAYNEAEVETCAQRRAIFDRAEADLVKVLRNTDDVTTHNIARFGFEQLERVTGREKHYSWDETKPHRRDLIEVGPDEWRELELERIKKDLELASACLDEIKKQETDRYEGYLKFVAEVDRILGGDDSDQ